LDNCVHNIEANFDLKKLEGSAVILREKMNTTQTYDLVVANILLETLRAEANVIINSISPGGELVISGVLVEQIDEITEFYMQYGCFAGSCVRVRADWAAITFEKFK